MDDKQHLEYSLSEDLFGDYDSFLGDESLLAKLEQADKMVAVGPAGEDCFLAVDAPDTDAAQENSPHGWQKAKRRKAHTSSTPHGSPEDRKRHGGAMRRSMSERVKKMLRSNATAPAGPSRSAAMKEAALSHEIGGAVRAVEAARADGNDLGPFFGLPAKVKDLLFTLRGIRSLYAWQETCLGLDCVSARRNLIYTLPTSGGKTLVAELLMIRELLCRNNNCIFVLPYVALVQEKVRGLAGLGLELDFLVEEYAGSKGRFPPVKRRGKRSLYVATIEKAHALVNALIEEGALSRVGLLVVDELHMLGEGSRGALLEITLAKVLHLSQDTQIIGMSATLGNIGELQTFLKAENYHDDFRPVRLKEYVKLGDGIYEVDPKEEECFRLCRRVELKYSSAMQKVDPDHIIALVTEVIPKHSCLVFCPTKKNCENVAVMICKYLRRDFLQHRQEDKEALLRELKGCGNGQLCPILRRTVPLGVAYHHSGLTGDERKLLEDAYSAGVLCLIACTSTLAAGINLPARRVIVRSPLVARDAVKTSQYKQMAGRAGRAGLDSEGESILILQEAQREQSANMRVVKRVYLSLVLMSLLKDGDVWGVAQKFQLTRGFIQSLLNSAAAFCSCVLHFTQELDTLWPYCSLLETLTRRLSYCVKAELIPLMEVAGVMEARAKQLHAAGYTTLSHLANADVTLLVRTVERLSRKQATLIVASAKMLLIEKAAALQQEVDHLLAAPPDLPD